MLYSIYINALPERKSIAPNSFARKNKTKIGIYVYRHGVIPIALHVLKKKNVRIMKNILELILSVRVVVLFRDLRLF